MKIKNKQALFLVVTETGETLAGCSGGERNPGVLLKSSHVSLFRSHRHARSYVLRTARWARAEKLPWARTVRHWRVVAVALHLAEQ
jgi:hypothetical protein